jgi:ribosomal protein L11 methyltransferase
VVPEDWESSWKAYYQPVALPHGYWIVPEWESLPDVPACRQVRLDPGMAFGTGTHPTTRMCLGALTAMPLRGRRLLDLGAGSGILGILALKRGATVTFVEPDPVAVQALRKNLELNRVADRATVVMGTLSALPPQQFEVVCFNVIWEVVRDSWASLVRYLAPHATVLVSGLLEERLCDMVALAKTSGLAVEEVQQEDGWVMVGLTNGQNQS